MAKYFFIILIFIIVSVSVFYGLVYKSESTNNESFNSNSNQKANNWGGPPVRTALHDAVFNKTYEDIEDMLVLGANPNAIDENGQTPVHFAAFFGKLDVLKLLIDHGGDVNMKDNYNWKPLDLVIEKPANEDILDFLEEVTEEDIK